MRQLPSRLRRLDDALADLPVDDDDAMLLSELDGFLTGIAVCPQPIAPDEWLPHVWRQDRGGAPFPDPVDARQFADMVVARHDEIVRDLARGKVQPIFDVDERHGEILWELWIEGFDAAVALRPEDWPSVSGDDAADAFAYLTMLTAVAFDDTTLTSEEINTVCDAAPGLIPARVATLYAWRSRHGVVVAQISPRAAKIGRNDPCPCGSGRKYKRCCGSA